MTRTKQADELTEAWGDVVPNESQWGDAGGYGVTTRYQRQATTLYDRADGRYLPVYQTEFDLACIRAMGRTLAELSNPLIGGLKNLCNYTIGEGMKFTATKDANAREDEDTVAPLVALVQREIDWLLDDNDFTSNFDHEIHRCSLVDGESFLQLKRRHDGRVRIYRREPDELREPADPRGLNEWLAHSMGIDCDAFVPSWSFGVLTREDETDSPLAYHVVADESGADWDCVPASQMVHIKRNVPRNAKRGFSDLYPVEGDATRGYKLIKNMAQGAAARASIIFIREFVAGTTRTGAEATLGSKPGNGTVQVQPGLNTNGGQVTVERFDKPRIVNISAGMQMKPPPTSEETADFLLVAKEVQRQQAVRWCMPEYMFTSDASNANYSSTLVAESPFVKNCETEQRFYSRHFVNLIWKALRMRWEIGTFGDIPWGEIERLIKITAECPEVATRNELANAQRDDILVKQGVLSRKTLATRNGLDYDTEVANGAAPEGQQAGAVDENGQPVAPQMGGEHVGRRIRDVTNIDKLRKRYLDAFKAGEASEQETRLKMASIGDSPASIDAWLDADPTNDPVEQPDAAPLPESIMDVIREEQEAYP